MIFSSFACQSGFDGTIHRESRLSKAEGSSADMRKPGDSFETLARTDGIISDTTARILSFEKLLKEEKSVSVWVQLEIKGM